MKNGSLIETRVDPSHPVTFPVIISRYRRSDPHLVQPSQQAHLLGTAGGLDASSQVAGPLGDC